MNFRMKRLLIRLGKVVLIVVGVIGALGGICIVWAIWIAATSLDAINWRDIDQPELLRRECHALMNAYSNGEIPRPPRLPQADTNGVRYYGISKLLWPEYIRNLKPRGLFVTEDTVSLMTTTGGGMGDPLGYLVLSPSHTNLPPDTKKWIRWQKYRIKKTKDPYIYQWTGSK